MAVSVYLWPALFALFAWWFSTGAIIWLDGLPQRTFKWSMLAATAAAGLSLYGLLTSATDGSLSGAYLAFASALGLWAWHEMSFYMGYVTGPRKHACAPGCRGWAHFGHALQVSLWHELAIVGSFLVVWWMTADAPNRTGLWTFVILWWMHESARLNVFLGVRNVNAQFLPEHLAYLKSFLAEKPMNGLFPISVTVSTAIFGVLVAEAAFATDPAAQAGLTFLAAMMGLAIAEHWLLILPLPAELPWNWAMSSRAKSGADAGHHHHLRHDQCRHDLHGAPSGPAFAPTAGRRAVTGVVT